MAGACCTVPCSLVATNVLLQYFDFEFSSRCVDINAARRRTMISLCDTGGLHCRGCLFFQSARKPRHHFFSWKIRANAGKGDHKKAVYFLSKRGKRFIVSFYSASFKQDPCRSALQLHIVKDVRASLGDATYDRLAQDEPAVPGGALHVKATDDGQAPLVQHAARAHRRA